MVENKMTNKRNSNATSRSPSTEKGSITIENAKRSIKKKIEIPHKSRFSSESPDSKKQFENEKVTIQTFMPTFVNIHNLLFLYHHHGCYFLHNRCVNMNKVLHVIWRMCCTSAECSSYAEGPKQMQMQNSVKLFFKIWITRTRCKYFTCLVVTALHRFTYCWLSALIAHYFCECILRTIVCQLKIRLFSSIHHQFIFGVVQLTVIFISLLWFLFRVLIAPSSCKHGPSALILDALLKVVKRLFAVILVLINYFRQQRIRRLRRLSTTRSKMALLSVSPPLVPRNGEENCTSVVVKEVQPEIFPGGKAKNRLVLEGRNRMKCHMDWIGDFMPMYVTPDEKLKYLTEIIQKLSDWMEDTKERITNPGTAVNLRMMMAGFHAYLGKFNEGLDWISEAADYWRMMKDEHPGHFRAYAYLLQINLHKINRRMKLMEGMSLKHVDEGAAQDIKEIEGLYCEDDGPFQATIWASKGVLAAVMLRRDEQIAMFRKAAELEEDCDQWHRLLYQALRRKRREAFIRLSYKSDEEKKAIEKAYSINPNNCLNQCLYAGMLEEKIKCFNERRLMLDSTKAEYGDQIISLLMKSLEQNPQDRWSHVRLAEIYGYGNFPNLDPNDGERMFEELEERWPESSMVLHKFGKYFMITKKDPVKAFEYFTRALECDSSNYPCLMDYLRACKIHKNGYEQGLKMLDRCLTHFFTTELFVKMMLAKGILLWLLENDCDSTGTGSHKQACQAWVEAAAKDPPSCAYIAKTISSGSWEVIGKYKIDIIKLLSILKVFLSVAKSERNLDLANAAEGLMSELQKELRIGHRHRISTSSSGSFSTARTSFSQADSADNWREAAPQLPPLIDGRGIFARYVDPMEQRFGVRYGYAGTTVCSQASSLADMDNDWRR